MTDKETLLDMQRKLEEIRLRTKDYGTRVALERAEHNLLLAAGRVERT